MADYNSMKVPELKKLLNERGLTQTGNKADLIARLVDNDKQQAKDSAPEADKTKKANDEDEIDYDDDDFTGFDKNKKDASAPARVSAKPADTSSKSTAPAAKVAQATTETKTTAEPATATISEATTKSAEKEAEKTVESAPAPPSFSQHLAPTNAKSEAEKRAARAARFGITAEADTEDSKKATRAERFGIAKDAVSALDSALPDRPRKRGRDRGTEDKEDDSRANKQRRPGGVGGPAPQGGQSGGRNAGGRNNRRNRRGGTPKEGGNANGQKKASSAAVDPAEKARMEARAKRFAASS